ncbi:MAG: molecular chaperone HtpG, partial [Clostridia bacterium]|nr:molecular chaperone HtpG [Clostridia bacterium]
ALRALFQKVSDNDKLTVKFETLKDADTPVILNVSEESRRMEDMMKMYRMSGGEGDMPAFPVEATLIVNTASPLVARITEMQDGDSARAESFAAYLYRLAVLSQRRFNAEEMQSFLKDSYRILSELSQ